MRKSRLKTTTILALMVLAMTFFPSFAAPSRTSAPTPPGPQDVELRLMELQTQPDGVVTARVELSAESLQELDHASFDSIVHQIAVGLAQPDWRELHIETRDPVSGEFVPLADFLPELPTPRKEAPAAEGEPQSVPLHIGQPPVPGQGQPQGALSDKTVYVSAGHGWEWDYDGRCDCVRWKTQRPPYPYPPYEEPIIEDHNNAEAVNQYLLQYLWNAGAMVWPARERDMNEVELIVDNDAPAPGTGYAESGAWTTTASEGYAEGDYRWAETTTCTPTATAVWSATLPADGRYAVYVWYYPSPNRAPDARYTIHHAGGETAISTDQRHHGLTWHYLGTYGFRAGEEASIRLSNQSAAPGSVVVADAVRFGGGVFDDLSDLVTAATYPPDKPWWEVAAYYYVQRMGMDAPYGDVTARPIYARWEHKYTGDDAVYVSWHTNGYSGYQDDVGGTVSIIHNGYGYPITPGSEELRDIVHDELVQDIRAGWDASWPGYKRSMNLGELRALWDSEIDALGERQIPGALFEIAYHDNIYDADALKEPTFNMLAARAMYQGIVKYFEQRDGVDLTLLPEPPTHLAVRNAGGGRVRVSWRPSPTDTLDLSGDPATGYRVYTSTDGLGWSNGAAVTGTTAYTLSDLSAGQLLFVRVTATNDGGDSFATETLAVRVGDGAEVLLVNGFDRLNRTMTLYENDPIEGENQRIFLDQMNRYDYVIQHAEVISYPFDSLSNEALQEDGMGLGGYTLVDWILGEESAQDETLDATERSLLTDFLENGGALFISGSEIGYDLDIHGVDPDFYNQVLRADYVGDDAGTYEVEPLPGSIFEGLASFRFDAPGMYDVDYPDQIMPINSTAALEYSGGLGGTAAVQYAAEPSANSCERLVYFGFPFETIRPEQRAEVMARVIDFLGLCITPPVNTSITSPQDGSLHNSVPPFEGMAEAGPVVAEYSAELDRVEVQIRHTGEYSPGESSEKYWTGSDWVTQTAWLNAQPLTGTVTPTLGFTLSWSYPLTDALGDPLAGDGDYELYARAWTTGNGGYSDTTPAEVSFVYDTTPPTITKLVTPTGGFALPAPLSVKLRWEPVAPDGGSALAYRVGLDGEVVYTTTQTAYTITKLTGGLHTWGVQVFDVAGNTSAWVTDTFRYPSLETAITAPLDGSAHNAIPRFAGIVMLDDVAVLDRTEVQVQREADGYYWDGTAWLTETAWLEAQRLSTQRLSTQPLTSTGGLTWTYALTDVVACDDGGCAFSYTLRARAYLTDGEIDLSPAQVHFIHDTIPPTATRLITPTGGFTVTATGVRLSWEPVGPDGGSALAYRVAVDDQIYTTTQAVYTITHLADGPHTWGVQVFDAATNHSAWVTDTFFIQRSICWLPLVLRNFEEEPSVCTDAVVNGGFESDDGWLPNQLAIYATDQVHSGTQSARVGIPPGEPGSPVFSSMAQTIALPEGESATLRLWFYPIGEGEDADDTHYVILTDQSDNYHYLYLGWSDVRSWEQMEYDLSAHTGTTVTLYIGTRNDGDDDTAAMYVDDVELEVCP